MSEVSSVQLDNLETSGASRPPSTYRSYCEKHYAAELIATEEAYLAFGSDHHRDYLQTLRSCRTGAWFVRNKISGKVRVLSSACHLRWCPMCSSTRQWFLTQEVSAWLKSIKKPKFLTLTLVHTSNSLESQIVHLYKCFQKFRKLKLLTRNIAGGVWFFQIKKSSKDGLWHPHFHCVIDSEFISKYELSMAWEGITLTSKIIDIKVVWNVDSAANEVARYASRPAMLYDLTPSDRLELLESMHGRRLVGTWGNARSISLRPSKPPDADEWIYVGKFSTVSLFYSEDYRAKALWDAYVKDQPVGPDCDLHALEKDLAGEAEAYFSGPITPHQAMLDFY